MRKFAKNKTEEEAEGGGGKGAQGKALEQPVGQNHEQSETEADKDSRQCPFLQLRTDDSANRRAEGDERARAAI